MKRVVLAVALLTARPLAAQDVNKPVAEVTHRTLDRTITLRLTEVPLKNALDTIAALSGVRFIYGVQQVPLGMLVTLAADRITVGQALYLLLQDSGLEAIVPAPGLIALHPRPSSARQQAGTIAGRITDAKTGLALADVAVAIVNTKFGATSALDGRYRIRGVPFGHPALTFRRLGYISTTRAIDVSSDSTVLLDVPLDPTPAVLSQIVTTATGEHARYEVGNLIETVRADSVIAIAPITSLTDVVNARVPGVQVFENGGTIGASPSINIRGQNSLTVSNQPLLYIDGVRVDNSAADSHYGPAANGTYSLSSVGGRFDDVSPEEIASIEVVKGPSAATLYGTDAANGVILITTKRGQPGHMRWDFSSEVGTLSEDTTRVRQSYYSWGHTTDGTATPVACPLLDQAAKACAVDSLTHYSPIVDPATTPVASGSRQRYGAQVSGGSGQTRYFASGTWENEVAPLKMPGPDRAMLEAERGGAGLEPDNIRPNALAKASGRVNLTTSLGSTADLTLTSSLVNQDLRTPIAGIWQFGEVSPGFRDANDGWNYQRPSEIFAARNRESALHAMGSAATIWRPLSWLTGRATVGIDYSTNYLDQLARPGENSLYPGDLGERVNGHANTGVYSADVGLTASASLWQRLSSKTSFGAQYDHRADIGNSAQATSLAAGTLTVAGGAAPFVTEYTSETIVAGAYGEQTFGLNDRLFVTGGLRADGASSFGRQFSTKVYPKASATWLVTAEPWVPRVPGLSSLRLRVAYGESGVQPGPTDALATVNVSATSLNGQGATGVVLGTLGDPRLRPETQREFEAGFDLEAIDHRVQLNATYYNKRSADALVNVPVPAQLGLAGGGAQEENVGSVRNLGYEIGVNVELLRGRAVSWSVGVSGSNNQNRLLALASGVSSIGAQSFTVGSPLYSIYDFPLAFRDANRNGIIEADEITVGSSPSYLGAGYPTSQITWQTSVGVLHDQLQVHVLVDSRAGATIRDYILQEQADLGVAPQLNDPHASLSGQAAVVGYTTAGTLAGFYENGAFTRLREVSLTYTLPARLIAPLRVRSASLTLSGRNLVLWTRYRGTDPEVNSFPSGGQAGQQGAAFLDLGATPINRYYMLQLRVGF